MFEINNLIDLRMILFHNQIAKKWDSIFYSIHTQIRFPIICTNLQYWGKKQSWNIFFIVTIRLLTFQSIKFMKACRLCILEVYHTISTGEMSFFGFVSTWGKIYLVFSYHFCYSQFTCWRRLMHSTPNLKQICLSFVIKMAYRGSN